MFQNCSFAFLILKNITVTLQIMSIVQRITYQLQGWLPYREKQSKENVIKRFKKWLFYLPTVENKAKYTVECMRW